jgi:hypothetical protein
MIQDEQTSKTQSETALNSMTNTTAPMTQLQIASFILRFKRIYRKNIQFENKLREEIRHHRRQIKLTAGNPFFKHSHSVWQDRIDQLKDALKDNQVNQHQEQEALVNLIQLFDEAGPAPIHVYAAVLSIHHCHVERAWAEGDKSLMDLIFISKLEVAHTKADVVSDDAVLHHAVTEVTIREILRNKALKKTADNLIQKMAQNSLGRPLQKYQQVELPNGQTVLKSMPPKLTVV